MESSTVSRRTKQAVKCADKAPATIVRRLLHARNLALCLRRMCLTSWKIKTLCSVWPKITTSSIGSAASARSSRHLQPSCCQNRSAFTTKLELCQPTPYSSTLNKRAPPPPPRRIPPHRRPQTRLHRSRRHPPRRPLARRPIPQPRRTRRPRHPRPLHR